MIAQYEAGEIVCLALKRTNERLVLDGIKEWDKVGEGCFAAFMRWYLIRSLIEIARWN